MDDLLTLTRPAMRARRPELVPAAIVAVVVAVLFVLASLSIQTPGIVTLTVVNPLPWRADVSVRSANSASWTEIGSVARDGQLPFLAVPDQGSDWVVRFTYAGETAEIEISRTTLEAQGWTVPVPTALGERLRSTGVAPTTGSAAGAASANDPAGAANAEESFSSTG